MILQFSDTDIIIDLTETNDQLELGIGTSHHNSYTLPNMDAGFISIKSARKLRTLKLNTWVTKSMGLERFDWIENLIINRKDILEGSDSRMYEYNETMTESEIAYIKTIGMRICHFTFIKNCFSYMKEMCMPAKSGEIRVWNRPRKDVSIYGPTFLELKTVFMTSKNIFSGKLNIGETVERIRCNNDAIDMINKLPLTLKELIINGFLWNENFHLFDSGSEISGKEARERYIRDRIPTLPKETKIIFVQQY